MDYKEKVIALLNSQELSKEQKEKLENIFPELKESEDEDKRISKEISRFLKQNNGWNHEWLTWLEKQDKQQPTAYGHKFREGDIVKSKSRPTLDARKIISVDKNRGCYWCEDNMCFGFIWEDDYELVEQKPVDKIGPKFKAGDWIVDDETPNDVFCVIESLEEIYKVIDIDGDDYHIPHCKADKQFHLWTIQDAKDGDVLATDNGNCPFIYRTKTIFGNPVAYCGVRSDGLFISESPENHQWCLKSEVIPATKEQRDLLFQKMKEAAYEWDADKKKIKKMEVSSKESEDDKMKREILELVSIAGIDYNQYEEIKDWLEKQSKKMSADEVLKIRREVYQSGYNDGYKHGHEDKEKELSEQLIEKQGEQKSTDKAEPKFKAGDWL